jgi:hypothetical protein
VSEFANLLAGTAAVISVSGIGRGMIRFVTKVSLPLHWYVALSMLGGVGIASVVVQITAMIGTDRRGFELLAAVICLLGLVCHICFRNGWMPLAWKLPGKIGYLTLGMLVCAVACSCFAALAPSSKIDELTYHMLASRRVVEDGGLRIYQFPSAQAIVPQMGYQVALSVFHAMGTPDAGNLLSLAFGVTLLFLLYGVALEQTARPSWALLAAMVSAIGIYPSLWHVTSGPHSLGDLATTTATAALFFPGGLLKVGTRGQLAACALASAVAASTKISLVPLGLLLTIGVVFAPKVRRTWLSASMLAAGIWLALDGPLIVWTFWQTGSPFGAATAQLFHSHAYEPAVFADLAATRRVNQTGLWIALRTALLQLNGAYLLLLLLGIASCLLRWKRLGFLLFLLAMQTLVIAIVLPHDFRFLGGLQYVCVLAGLIAAASVLLSQRVNNLIRVGLIVLAIPWLGAQAYYVLPFAKEDLGLISRTDFLNRYVAFMDDFSKLDKLLPAGSELYVTNLRPPSVYFPRPVIFSASDWDRRSPLFRFRVSSPGERAPTEGSLRCPEPLYTNKDAIIETYRTPGHAPRRGILIVEACEFIAGHGL